MRDVDNTVAPCSDSSPGTVTQRRLGRRFREPLRVADIGELLRGLRGADALDEGDAPYRAGPVGTMLGRRPIGETCGPALARRDLPQVEL
jgi:hypothetical protein